MKPIDKVINQAKEEVGYMEKASNSNLYDKTANAGSANYTKYWAEIDPSLQGQPWCAAFVTYVFDKAFGGPQVTKKLLKHYPFIYCPKLGTLFTLNANPKRGDIVLFYRNGEFAHTGIVTSVDGDKFYTIEGNTSAGSSIIPNGGQVCEKSYYNSKLPGTKFVTPDYSIVDTDEMKDIYDRMNSIYNKFINAKPKIYNTIEELPEYAKTPIKYLVDKGILKGTDDGKLNMPEDMMRILIIFYRVLINRENNSN